MKRFVKDFSKVFFFLFISIFMVACDGEEDTVSPNPTADFTFAADATTPGKINFTNTSVNASSYLWEFGDGNTSTLASPSHTYTGNGTYEVKLIAMNGSSSGGKLPGKEGGSGTGTTKTVTVTNSQSTLNAKMTGSSSFDYTGSQVQAVRSGSQIIISGIDSGILMELRVPINAVAGGTYSASSSNTSITYTTSIDTYHANSTSCSGSNGTIKVTSISATNISGTFSGKVYRGSCGGYFTINSGNFSVKF